MDQRPRLVNPSADETEAFDLPPVKMCEECGRFPCPHWFDLVRQNNPALMHRRRVMRRTLWSRWPRGERSRGSTPIAMTAVAVGALIAGVGFDACISGSAPTRVPTPSPYVAIGPGSTGVPPDGGPTGSGGPTLAGGPAGGSSAAGVDAGSQPVVASPAGGGGSGPTHAADPTPAPSRSPTPEPITITATPAPVQSVVATATSVLPKITIEDGTVRVGIDVPSGTYVAEVAPLTCTWKILDGGLLGTIVGVSTLLGGTQTVHLKGGQTFTNKNCGGFVKQ